MSSPLDDPQMEQWFARFNIPLKRLPAEERAELHAEVRQHLDALVAANKELGSSHEEAWQLALKQFGDPKKIARRMFQECQESRSGARLGWYAAGFGFLLYLPGIICPSLIASHFQSLFHVYTSCNVLLGFVSAVLIPLAIGRKYPFHAIQGAFYSPLFWLFVGECLNVQLIFKGSFVDISPHFVVVFLGSFLRAMLEGCVIAYLASVTKRGWYKPTVADFKLTLPRRRRQLSR